MCFPSISDEAMFRDALGEDPMSFHIILVTTVWPHSPMSKDHCPSLLLEIYLFDVGLDFVLLCKFAVSVLRYIKLRICIRKLHLTNLRGFDCHESLGSFCNS